MKMNINNPIWRRIFELEETITGKTSPIIYFKRNIFNIRSDMYMSKVKFRGLEFYCTSFEDHYMLPEHFWGKPDAYSIPECHIEKGDVVIDCGGHIGFYSLFASEIASKVFAFEPIPKTYDVLYQNIILWDKYDKIIPVNRALSSNTIPKTFYFFPNRTYGSTQYLKVIQDMAKNSKTKVKKDYEEYELISVASTTIDHFVENKKIKNINFIKVNTEGSDVEVIKGAKETIKNFKPKIVTCEHNPGDNDKILKFILSIRNDYKYINANNRLYLW